MHLNYVFLLLMIPTLAASPGFTADKFTPAPEFHWTGKSSDIQKLAIKGVVGTITVESVAGDTVDVTAVTRAAGEDTVHVQVVQGRGTVAICAIYANAKGTDPSACDDETSWCKSECDGRGPKVDFVVRLPQGIRSLNLAGVNTVVAGRFTEQAWPDQFSIRTISGNIDLQLPKAISTNLDLQIPGRHLRSQFAILRLHSNRSGHLTGAIGKGDGWIRISTVSGYVTLRKTSKPEA